MRSAKKPGAPSQSHSRIVTRPRAEEAARGCIESTVNNFASSTMLDHPSKLLEASKFQNWADCMPQNNAAGDRSSLCEQILAELACIQGGWGHAFTLQSQGGEYDLLVSLSMGPINIDGIRHYGIIIQRIGLVGFDPDAGRLPPRNGAASIWAAFKAILPYKATRAGKEVIFTALVVQSVLFPKVGVHLVRDLEFRPKDYSDSDFVWTQMH